MQPHSFSKRQLVVITLMLDEEEKNATLSDAKGTMKRASSIIGFPEPEEWWKCIWNIKPGISNLSEDPSINAGVCGQHYFCDLCFA
jgi:hypothetical protein